MFFSWQLRDKLGKLQSIKNRAKLVKPALIGADPNPGWYVYCE